MIRYDEHAEFQIERRGIDKAWIEETIRNPDETEDRVPADRSFSEVPARPACYAARRDTGDDPEFVITAYFDRTKPCA